MEKFKETDSLIDEFAGENEVEEDSYKVKLSNFEGPLDLLLHLIKVSKLDIQEIKLSEITEQYLQYMEQLETLDMEKAADFIEVAATLIEIKSKSVLPRDEELKEDEEDSESELLRRLQEYKLFKEAGEKLTIIENVDKFYKEPDKSANDYRIVLSQMNMDNLVSAFTHLLHKIDVEEQIIIPKTIEKDRFTVEEKTFEIRTILIKEKKLKFSELVENDYSRSEIITIFLALLEMLRLQEIKVTQEEEFSDIEIIKCEENDGE
ncbi:MAG: ScpA family protein [Spirochaetales bacterium]